jgi:hypothetical protein
MFEVEVMNGTIKTGDLVLSMPGNDYGGLVGTVTDIKLLGSIDRETANETDDIYVDFSGSNYSEKRRNEIEKAFMDMYDEHRPFDDLPLDKVIMPPDALINITSINADELCGLLNSEEIAIFYWNCIPYGKLSDGVPLKDFKAEPDTNKKRCKCGHDRFTAQQRCYHNVIVDSKNAFVDNNDIYESENPYGPYNCERCGLEYEDLNNLFTFIRVRFHHDDCGNCTTTFKTVCKEKSRYFNRSDCGSWYTVYPSNGYWESDSTVKKNVIFQIVNKEGKVLFTESNGFSERPFSPVNIFLQNTAKAFAKEHKLNSHEQWQEYMTNCPEYDEFIKKNYRDNWLYCEVETLQEKMISQFEYLDFKYEIIETLEKHRISGLEYRAYRIKMRGDNIGGGDTCGYKFQN